MQTLMQLLTTDNEENGVLCLKIIVDLHKNYTVLMEDQVQGFLNLVRELYMNMEQSVHSAFQASFCLFQEQQPDPKPIPKCLYSFKVLTECPIIVALLFQLHRNFVTSNVPSFVEPIIKVLLLQPPQQSIAHMNAANQGTIFLGMSPNITNPTLYVEYKSLQVKVIII